MPLGLAGTNDSGVLRDNHIFQAVARLKSGVLLEHAQSRLSVMGANIAREYPIRAGTNWKLHTLVGYIVEQFLRRTLLVLFVASLLVLAIACVNLSTSCSREAPLAPAKLPSAMRSAPDGSAWPVSSSRKARFSRPVADSLAY